MRGLHVLAAKAGEVAVALVVTDDDDDVGRASGLGLGGVRLDLTEQKLYTISEGTEQILAGLEEPIELSFFYSDTTAKDLPALRNYASELAIAMEELNDGSGAAVTGMRRRAPSPRGSRATP